MVSDGERRNRSLTNADLRDLADMINKTSESDVKDLWSAITEIRSNQASTNAILAEIRAMLAERCTIRGKTQDDHTTRIERIERKIYIATGISISISAALAWAMKLAGTIKHGG